MFKAAQISNHTNQRSCDVASGIGELQSSSQTCTTMTFKVPNSGVQNYIANINWAIKSVVGRHLIPLILDNKCQYVSPYLTVYVCFKYDITIAEPSCTLKPPQTFFAIEIIFNLTSFPRRKRGFWYHRNIYTVCFSISYHFRFWTSLQILKKLDTNIA